MMATLHSTVDHRSAPVLSYVTSLDLETRARDFRRRIAVTPPLWLGRGLVDFLVREGKGGEGKVQNVQTAKRKNGHQRHLLSSMNLQ